MDSSYSVEWVRDGFGHEATIFGFGLGVWEEVPGWAWSVYNAWGQVASGISSSLDSAKQDAESVTAKLVADALEPVGLAN